MIHLEVIVADTDDLLDVNAFGPGALLHTESATLMAGPFGEVDSQPLDATKDVYDVWDAAGVAGTWYRARVSDVASSTFSPYISPPFQSTGQGLYLSVDQMRSFGVAGSEEALLILANAATQRINRAVGALGDTTEVVRAGQGSLLMVSREILSVTSITEGSSTTPVVLASDDYEVQGTLLVRLRNGTNPSSWWRGRVKVVYQPVDDLAERQRVQLELVRLDLNTDPGVIQRTIGTFAESFGGPGYQEQRAAILASLTEFGVYIR